MKDNPEDLDAIEPLSPILSDALRRALQPYDALLPARITQDFEHLAGSILSLHPVGISVVARLSPGLHASVNMSEDAHQRGFQGYAVCRVDRALLNGVRKMAREKGIKDFILPDASIAGLQTFIGYLSADSSIWSGSEDEIREIFDDFCSSVIGVFFMGLVYEAQTNPSSMDEWGDVGRAFAEVLPRAAAVLRGALARMTPRERRILKTYEDCGWDLERILKRHDGRKLHQAGTVVFRSLGEVIPAELLAAAAR